MLYEEKRKILQYLILCDWTEINWISNITLSLGFSPCLGISYSNCNIGMFLIHCFCYIIQISIKFPHTVHNLKGGVCCVFPDCCFDGSWKRKKGQESLKWLAFELYVRCPLGILRKRKGKVWEPYKNMEPSKWAEIFFNIFVYKYSCIFKGNANSSSVSFLDHVRISN